MTFKMGPAARLARTGVAVVGACLTLASAGAACAQVSASGAAPKPLDPERVAIARQIFDQIGASTLQSMSKALISSMQAAMTKTVSGPDAQRQQAMMDAVSDSVTVIMPKAIDATVDAMAQNFDTAQLKDVLAFYQSPTGRVMISKMPPDHAAELGHHGRRDARDVAPDGAALLRQGDVYTVGTAGLCGHLRTGEGPRAGLALEHFPQKWVRFCGQKMLQVFELEPFLSDLIDSIRSERALAGCDHEQTTNPNCGRGGVPVIRVVSRSRSISVTLWLS